MYHVSCGNLVYCPYYVYYPGVRNVCNVLLILSVTCIVLICNTDERVAQSNKEFEFEFDPGDQHAISMLSSYVVTMRLIASQYMYVFRQYTTMRGTLLSTYTFIICYGVSHIY
jgi:hypothetical protein